MNWNKSHPGFLHQSVLVLVLMLVSGVAWADKPSKPSSSSSHSSSSSSKHSSSSSSKHSSSSSKHTAKSSHGKGASLKGGGTARTRPHGSIRSIDKNGVHIERNLHGGRTIVSTHVGARIVTTGKHVGYVQRAYINRGGHLYYSRTYYDHGVYRTGVYRDYYYRGHTYYVYHRPYWYDPPFYRWVYEPWPAPVYWLWGWGGAPWYGYYGAYFAPYPVYLEAALWLTDYLIAMNLQAAYAEQAEADADAAPVGGAEVVVRGNKPWTDTGTFVNAGDEITIIASGGVTMGLGWAPMSPAGRSPNCNGSGFPVREFPCWSLIGRVGDAPIFYVGDETKLRASNAGELLLGVNDNVLWDNGGNWVANIMVPAAGSGPDQTNAAPTDDQAAGTGQPASAPGTQATLSPEVKQAIAEEVKAQIAAAQALASQSNSSGGDQQFTRPGEEVPPALDPAHRIFVVSSDLALVADGRECSLTPGDVITRLTDTPDQDGKVNVSVASSKKNDCAAGRTVAVAVNDLQEMRNRFLEQIDEGLKTLAAKQGTGGLPTAPDTGTRASDMPAPPVDSTAGKALEDQETAADQTEAEVKQ